MRSAPALKYFADAVDQFVVEGEAAVGVGFDVHVRVDRGNGRQVDAHLGGSGNCWPTLC